MMKMLAADFPLRAVHDAIISCERCPRLRSYCRRVAQEKKRAHRTDAYWGRPVPGFGDPDARLLLVGLAPAAHGANRTGRVFTGDGSGDFLMAALKRTGFANLETSRRADDGLRLTDAYILATVRCAPPDNKPLPEEIARCREHLEAEIALLPRLSVVVALGKIAFDGWLQVLRQQGVTISPRPQFAHGVVVDVRKAGLVRRAGLAFQTRQTDQIPKTLPAVLIGCYHPSRQNTNTGKLTARMMESVFRKARRMLDG